MDRYARVIIGNIDIYVIEFTLPQGSHVHAEYWFISSWVSKTIIGKYILEWMYRFLENGIKSMICTLQCDMWLNSAAGEYIETNLFFFL